MSKVFIKKNIYARDGVLLLAAGQWVPEEMFKKLENMDYIEADPDVDYDDIEENQSAVKSSSIDFTNTAINNSSTYRQQDTYKLDIKRSTEKMKLTLKLRDRHILNTAAEALEKVVFESRKQPWFPHVNALSNYVDWLYSHSIDVALLSLLLAQELQLDGKLEEIAVGAFFHDIGELLIPRHILQKSGPLTEDEMFFMRQHCDLGVSMLINYDFSPVTLDVIRYHHEKMDGSGYPCGLKGESIPIHVRIVMVANSINSMTSYRPYKPMINAELALMELKKNKNKYPQDIVDLLCRLM